MALTGNKIIKSIPNYRYESRDVVAGAIHVYRGALLNSDASGNVKLSTDAASELFAGVAVEELDQAATASAGDNQSKVLSPGCGELVLMKLSGVTKASIGLGAYAKADDEVQLVGDATNDVLVGTIRGIEKTDYCWVEI